MICCLDTSTASKEVIVCKSVRALFCRGVPASASLPAEPIALLDEIESGLPFSSAAGAQQQKPGRGSEEQGKAKKHKKDKEKHKKESKEKKHKKHKKGKKAKEGGPSGLPHMPHSRPSADLQP